MSKNAITPLHPSRRSSITGIGVSLLVVAGLTLGLQWRAANADYPERRPMLVSVIEFSLQDTYNEESSFLGQVRAAKTSNMSFEIGGTLAQVMVAEGQRVAAGEILASLNKASLQARRDALAAQLKSTDANLELAHLQLKRQQKLVKDGSVSRAAFDESRLRVQALAAQLEASRAQLASVDIDLDKTVLRAPYSGTVAARYIDEGAVLAPGQMLLRLLTANALEAHVGLGPLQSEDLKVGQSYPLSLRKQRISAKLLALRPDVDPVTRSAQAIFQLPAGTRALDGEPITLQLQQQRVLRGGWLPLTALTESDRGLWAVLRLHSKEGETRVIREIVEVLAVQGERAYVAGSLPDAAPVVAAGISRLAPGSLVRVDSTAVEG